MKRRDILKLGLAGLVGLERLTKAIAGEILQQPEPTTVACDISAAALPVPVNCQPTPGGGYTLCGADNQNVTCYGVDQQGAAFDCTNYSCNRNFVCEDFTCFQGIGGDFNCYNSFDCAASDRGAQFHCQGSDFFTDHSIVTPTLGIIQIEDKVKDSIVMTSIVQKETFGVMSNMITALALILHNLN